MIIPRIISLPPPGEQSFFLWGPRQIGKSTLLKQLYPPTEHYWVNLLDRDAYRQYLARPESLREALGASPPQPGTQVVIDEIQEVPQLLPEIHLMIEDMGFKFALCGSSQRKLLRSRANFLGGRAAKYDLRGLTYSELRGEFNLEKIVNAGYFPKSYLAKKPGDFFSNYVGDYLYNEIISESIVRKLDSFQDFLEIAALRDGGKVNYSNIAGECGVSYKTVQSYYEILVDTQIGQWLKPYSKGRARSGKARKFYFSDVGLAKFLARKGKLLEGGTKDFGNAFENWVFHEISTFLDYKRHGTSEIKFSYWGDGVSEVDFLLGDHVAIEVKSSENITDKHLKGLRRLRQKHQSFETLIVVCRQKRSRRTDEGVLILNYVDFARRLWDGEFTEMDRLPLGVGDE